MNYKRLIIAIGSLFVVLILLSRALSSPTMSKFLGLSKSISESIVDIDTGVFHQSHNYSEYILMLSTDGLRAVSPAGQVAWTVSMSNVEPFMHISGSFILLTDLKGKLINIYTNNNLMQTIKTDETIITAKVNSKGYVVVATEETGYKGKVSVYNTNGREIYKWHSGEGYILDIDLSNNCKNLAISQMTTNADTITSNILMLDINKDEQLGLISRTDSLISTIKFNTNGNLVALSDVEMLGAAPSGEIKYVIDFQGALLSTFNIENDNNMIINLINSKNNSTLDIYSKDGRKRGTYSASSEIKNIAVSGELIVINQLRDIIRLTPQGRAIELGTVSHDIRNIKIFSDRKNALIIGGSTANIAKIR